MQRLPAQERERILKTVKLAQEFGAKTAILAGSDPASEVVEYARTHNCSKLVLGRTRGVSKWPWVQGTARRIGAFAPDIDLIEVGRGTAQQPVPQRDPDVEGETDPRRGTKRMRFLWAFLACLATTVIATPLLPYFDLANIVMLFLLTVVLIALKWGRGPAVLAAFVSVATFDFFFVPPRFSFAVSDVQYLLTFAVMLAVALIIGQMTAGLRYQARVASYREERARVLYEFARDMSSLLLTEDVVESATRIIANTLRAKVVILVPDELDRIQPAGKAQGLAIDIGAAQWAYDKEQPAGAGTDTLAGSEYLYLPLRAPMRTRGVLVIKPDNPRSSSCPNSVGISTPRGVDCRSRLSARIMLKSHSRHLIHMESERLRNSLLSALSHDLRTPLAALVGLAESLALTKPPMSPEQLESANAIAEEARRMSSLVNNLLEMARIESGEVKLRRKWHPFEEVVGSALKAAQLALADHRVELSLARDLPLVEFDATLIERVLYNLIENACKYTPAGTPITISAAVSAGSLRVSVSDSGPGIPKGQEESIFEKFTRGTRESSTPGVGLGLAISRAIIEAHHGKIFAENGPNGGARFTFTLPLGTPPGTPDESAVAGAA